MLYPHCKIVVGGQKYHGCVSFSVKKNVDQMSNTAVVKLPLWAIYKTEQKLLDINATINEEDEVIIYAGYENFEEFELFKGFVKSKNANKHIVLDCEDAIYKFKRTPLVVNKKEASLLDILKELCSKVGVELSDLTWDLKIDKINYVGNGAGFLKKLKDEFNLSVFIDHEDKLYVGGRVADNGIKPVKLVYGKNVIKNNVKYKTKKAYPLYVRVTGRTTDGKEIFSEAGEKGGDEINITRHNVSDKEVLQKIATEHYESKCFDGFSGSLTCFLIPFIQSGGKIKYINERYKDSEGVYYVKEVEYKTQRGLRQIIKPDVRL